MLNATVVCLLDNVALSAVEGANLVIQDRLHNASFLDTPCLALLAGDLLPLSCVPGEKKGEGKKERKGGRKGHRDERGGGKS